MDEAWFWEDMESKTKNAATVQMKLLQKIMAKNAGTEYLKRHGASDGTLSSFKRLPLVEYHELEKDIQRIANGDTSPVLCAEPVLQMFTSSGTSTGKPKLIPATAEYLELLFRRPVGLRTSDVCLAFLFAKLPSSTKGGLPVSTTSSTFVRNNDSVNLQTLFTSPLELLLAPDINQSIYCHLLCGLIRSDEVTRVYAALAKVLVEAFRALEEIWQELAEDIRTGTLSGRITDSNLRRAVTPLLKANPHLAKSICTKCAAAAADAADAWAGIIERLWPNVNCIVTVTTGAMATYVPALKKYAGELPIVTGDYVCTECLIGFNMDPSSIPEKVTFTMHPDYAYYEFLPCASKTNDDPSAKEPVGLADVQIGEEYELVVTTVSGLYRYKVGDVIRVIGFHNSSPKISFVHRVNAVLEIAEENTSEDELQRAINNSLHLLPAEEELVDFTSYKESASMSEHYVVVWELKSGKKLNPVTLQNCCRVLEGSLNKKYRLARAEGRIGPLQLCIVRRKTFDALLQYSLAKGTSPTQYKTPRCVNNPDLITILRTGITQQHSSPHISA